MSLRYWMMLCVAVLSSAGVAEARHLATREAAGHAVAASSTTTMPLFLRRAIHAAGLPMKDYGFVVYDLTRDRMVFHYQDQRRFHPASAMKVLTFSAAYDLLGYEYRWPTELYIEGKPSPEGVYHGNIYFKMHYNPQWMFEDLFDMAQALYEYGIHRIDGQIIIDASDMNWDRGELSSHRRDDPATRPYNVAPNPLMLNYRTLEFLLTQDADHRPEVLPNTLLPKGCVLLNHIQMHPHSASCSVMIASLSSRMDACHIGFSGQIGPHCFQRDTPWYAYISLMTHEAFFERSFRAIWEDDLHGAWHGTLRYDHVPESAHLFLVNHSEPLYTIAHSALKFSNNAMSQEVFLTLGRLNTHGPYAHLMTFPHARHVLDDWLSQHHLCASHEYYITNGSGFAYHTWITPACEYHVLAYDYHRSYFPLLRDNLPIVGVDGTMADRLTQSPVATHAWVKTGTFKVTRAIAGYVYSRDHHVYAVVSFVNDRHGAKPSLSVQDLLLTYLYTEGAEAFKSE